MTTMPTSRERSICWRPPSDEPRARFAPGPARRGHLGHPDPRCPGPRRQRRRTLCGRRAAAGWPDHGDRCPGTCERCRLDAPGARRIHADGLALAPGFIDMHAHSDLAVLTDREHLTRTLQGVTTEVIGQAGLSYAPVTDATMAGVRDRIAGWNGVPAELDFGWRSVAEYLAEIDRRGSATNVAYLLPQGTIRMNVIGTA